jgi:uncharacterized membrane protein YvbJ
MNPKQWREYLRDNPPKASMVTEILNDWENSIASTTDTTSKSEIFFDPFQDAQ